MTQILLELGTDTYIKCKHMFLAASLECPSTKAFLEMLFEKVDDKRPLFIEMKGGAA